MYTKQLSQAGVEAFQGVTNEKEKKMDFLSSVNHSYTADKGETPAPWGALSSEALLRLVCLWDCTAEALTDSWLALRKAGQGVQDGFGLAAFTGLPAVHPSSGTTGSAGFVHARLIPPPAAFPGSSLEGLSWRTSPSCPHAPGATKTNAQHSVGCRPPSNDPEGQSPCLVKHWP